ncbi:unnamed protein product, partial [marine sediment metagenome]
KTRGLILIGDKVAKPDLAELRRDTLKWAVQALRTTRAGTLTAGPAAYDAWAADMAADEFWPAGDLAVLADHLGAHYDAMTTVAERNLPAPWLRDAAKHEPAMAAHLEAAAKALDAEHETIYAMHDAYGGYMDPHDEKRLPVLADHAVREKAAAAIRAARDRHVEAADHIEKALLAAGRAGGQ